MERWKESWVARETVFCYGGILIPLIPVLHRIHSFRPGFHRSGTTYVYSRLCELLGHTVTHLIPYHVFHIRRLVHVRTGD